MPKKTKREEIEEIIFKEVEKAISSGEKIKGMLDKFVTNISSIKKTKDYNLFEYLDYGRPLNDANLKKIRESIIENGWYGTIIYVVKIGDKLFILDGQHRIIEIIALNTAGVLPKIDIEYRILTIPKEEDIPKVISILNIGKDFKTNDYRHQWAEFGIESYLYATELAEENGLSFNTIASLLGKVRASKEFQNGSWEITEEKRKFVDQCFKKIYDIINSSYHLKGLAESKTFAKKLKNALLIMVRWELYDHIKGIKKLSDDYVCRNNVYPKINGKDITVQQLIGQLEDVYYHRVKKGRIPFPRNMN